MTVLIVLLLVVVWLLCGIAGTLMFGPGGFWWGFLLGPVGLAIKHRRELRQQAETKRVTATSHYRQTNTRAAARERLASKGGQIRWPE